MNPFRTAQDPRVPAIITDVTSLKGRMTTAETNISNIQTAIGQVIDVNNGQVTDGELALAVAALQAKNLQEDTEIDRIEEYLNIKGLSTTETDIKEYFNNAVETFDTIIAIKNTINTVSNLANELNTGLNAITTSFQQVPQRITELEAFQAATETEDTEQQSLLTSHTTELGVHEGRLDALEPLVTTAQTTADTAVTEATAANTQNVVQDGLIAAQTAEMAAISAATGIIGTALGGTFTGVGSSLAMVGGAIGGLFGGLFGSGGSGGTANNEIKDLKDDVDNLRTNVTTISGLLEGYKSMPDAGNTGKVLQSYEVISGFPDLKWDYVNYNDIINKPTIPSVPTSLPSLTSTLTVDSDINIGTHKITTSNTTFTDNTQLITKKYVDDQITAHPGITNLSQLNIDQALDMKGTYKIINVLDPTSNQDVVTKGYLNTLLSGFSSTTASLPIGTVAIWTTASIPSGWLECNGQTVNSTTYPNLYALMTSTPDYRGMFLRGHDTGAGYNNSRILGSFENYNTGSHYHQTSTISSTGVNGHTSTQYSNATIGSGTGTGSIAYTSVNYDSATGTASSIDEVRVVNKAVKYIIKASVNADSESNSLLPTGTIKSDATHTDLNAGILRNLGTPSLGTDATNKTYVDGKTWGNSNLTDIAYTKISGAPAISTTNLIIDSDIALGSHKINTTATTWNSNELIPKSYADSLVIGGGSNIVDAPVGTINIWGISTIPTNWLTCNGQSIDKNLYPDLYTLYGGTGSNTVNVPDLRGVFVRGLDSGKNYDSGRTLGSYQDDDLKNHSHTWNGYNTVSAGSGSSQVRARSNLAGDPLDTVTNVSGGVTGTETRPKNIAMIYIIKAKLGATTTIQADTILPAGTSKVNTTTTDLSGGILTNLAQPILTNGVGPNSQASTCLYSDSGDKQVYDTLCKNIFGVTMADYVSGTYPPNYVNLKLWFDAYSDNYNLQYFALSSTSQVTGWYDKKGNGNLWQGSFRPTLVTNGTINNAVRFTKTGSQCLWYNGPVNFQRYATGVGIFPCLTIFMVVKFATVTAAAQKLFSCDSGYQVCIGMDDRNGSSAGTGNFYLSSFTTSTTGKYVTRWTKPSTGLPFNLDTSDYHVICAHWCPPTTFSSATNATRHSVWIDNKNVLNEYNVDGMDCTNYMSIGSVYAAAGTPLETFDGYMQEVLVYNKRMTTNERGDITNWLKNKWLLPMSFDV